MCLELREGKAAKSAVAPTGVQGVCHGYLLGSPFAGFQTRIAPSRASSISVLSGFSFFCFRTTLDGFIYLP